MTLLPMHLEFGPTETTLSSDDGGVIQLGPSPAALAQACFRHHQPTAAELERAIDSVEDALMAAKLPRAHDALLTTAEPVLCQLAGLDIVGNILGRDAIEALFQQLASIALSMPAPRSLTFTDRDSAAALLILRECMHHLGFDAIRIGPAA